MSDIPHITYNGDSKVILRMCETINAIIDRGGGHVSLLISKTVTANGTYVADDENALGYSSVVVNVRPGLLAPAAFDMTGGYVSKGAWRFPTASVCYTDVYAAEAGRPCLVALGSTVGTRFRAMFSTESTIGAAAQVDGESLSETKNPAPYAFLLYTPPENGFITITKDDAGTANIQTYVFDILRLIDGSASTSGGESEQSGGGE